MGLLLFLPAGRAEPLHHAIHFFYQEALGLRQDRSIYPFDAERLAALLAGEMDVGMFVPAATGTAAVDFGSGAVVHLVDETVFEKGREGAEYGGLVHRRESHFHISKCKGLGISKNLTHQQYPVRRGFDAGLL